MASEDDGDDAVGDDTSLLAPQSRRRLLLGLGSVGVSSLAGCGGSADTDADPGTRTVDASSSNAVW